MSGADDSGRRDGPITGLRHDATDPLFADDPRPYYRWLRDEAPVHWHEASGAFLISRFRDVWDVTSDWRTFSSESPVAKLVHMASLDPPKHDRLRGAVARSFTPQRIAAHEDFVRGVCRDLLDAFEADGGGDLVAGFATRFPSRVIHHLLGIPEAFDERLRICALAIGAARDAEQMASSMAELEAITEALVRGEEEPAVPGLLQALAEEGSGGLDEAERRGVCSNLVLAGTDTVTNLVGNGLVLLQRHPVARSALVRDPARIPAAVEEMLRVESPVQSLSRRVRRATQLHGVALPTGAELRLLWGAANLDPREFERPEAFDVDRPPSRHLALGQGIHFCLGAGLARLELRVAFEELLARWPDYVIDETQLRRVPSLWVKAWERIEIRVP